MIFIFSKNILGFVRLHRDKYYLRGTPSPLTRFFGNAHLRTFNLF